MSETWLDAIDTEDVGEGIDDSEDVGEGIDVGEEIGEADYGGLGEESRSTRRRRERQRQILLERQRQRQAQMGRQRRVPMRPQTPPPTLRPARAAGPSPRQTIAAVRSLDLETKVELDSLHRALEQSNRRAKRATWAAVASTAADQGIASFFTEAQNHPYVAAGVRFAPLLFLSPEKTRGGVEGFATDPRVIGGATILGIVLLGNFRSKAQGASTVTIADPGPITPGVGGTLTAVALDRNSVPLPTQPIFAWSSNSGNLTFPGTPPGAYTTSNDATGQVFVTAQGGGASGNLWITFADS
jgi:hypothetical protein